MTKTNDQQTIHNPHDKALFNALKNRKIARELIETALPHDLVKRMQLNKMRFYKTKLINPNYKEFQADIFYEVPIDKLAALILFHCEHQSKPEKDAPLRIWEYILLVLAEYLQNHPKKPLPIVYPIIIYTGEQPYTYSTNLFDLFGEHKELAEKYLFRDIQLIDVCRTPDEEIRQHQLFGLTEYAFKHKHTRQFEAFLEKILPWVNEVDIQIGGQYAIMIVEYILDVYPEGNYEKFAEASKQYLSNALGEKAMTIAQQLQQQGMEKGLEKGLLLVQEKEHQIVHNMLMKGMSIDTIAELTGLTEDEVNQLKAEMTH